MFWVWSLILGIVCLLGCDWWVVVFCIVGVVVLFGGVGVGWVYGGDVGVGKFIVMRFFVVLVLVGSWFGVVLVGMCV